MTPDTIATLAAVIGGFLGMWRLIEGVRRDLTNQIASVNTRIDNVLLADRPAGVGLSMGEGETHGIQNG